MNVSSAGDARRQIVPPRPQHPACTLSRVCARGPRPSCCGDGRAAIERTRLAHASVAASWQIGIFTVGKRTRGEFCMSRTRLVSVLAARVR